MELFALEIFKTTPPPVFWNTVTVIEDKIISNMQTFIIAIYPNLMNTVLTKSSSSSCAVINNVHIFS